MRRSRTTGVSDSDFEFLFLSHHFSLLNGTYIGKDTNILTEQIDKDVTRIHRLELENQKLQSELDTLKREGFQVNFAHEDIVCAHCFSVHIAVCFIFFVGNFGENPQAGEGEQEVVDDHPPAERAALQRV